MEFLFCWIIDAYNKFNLVGRGGEGEDEGRGEGGEGRGGGG